jgi:hypothetical protein
MSYSSAFADRIRRILSSQTAFIEKEMFGGVAFMVDDKMCVGINQDKRTGVDRLMARIDPEFYYSALKREGCREMDFAGRPMIGFVFIHPEGYSSDEDLIFWIGKSLEYNRVVPVSTVKKKRALLAPPEKKIRTVKPLPKYTPPKTKAPKAPAKSGTKRVAASKKK